MKPPLASKLFSEKFPRSSRPSFKQCFPPLRDTSPESSASVRSISPSVKRKAERTYANATKRSFLNSRTSGTQQALDSDIWDKFEQLDTSYAKVSSICEKTMENLDNLGDPDATALLKGLTEAVALLNEGQQTLAYILKKNQSEQNSIFSNLVQPQRPLNLSIPTARPPRAQSVAGQAAWSRENASDPPVASEHDGSENSVPIPVSNPKEAKLQNFREAVKNAERSTLIFNLDLGKTPIMNPKTIVDNSTMALINMAAAVENKPVDRISSDTVEQIDDALSMASNVSFFGSKTKTYRNPSDPTKSGSFCTVPVKYDFKDRNTRISVEQMLREKCKVNCSVPYPPILRACIKSVIDSGKKAIPNHFVRVSVDTNKMVLKLSWREPNSREWQLHPLGIPIPEIALDVKSRTIPDEITLDNLPTPFQPQITVTGSGGHNGDAGK